VSKMPKTKGRQTTVKIPEGLLDTVSKFVDSPKAKALGLDSKSDVIREAVIDFLKKYDFVR